MHWRSRSDVHSHRREHRLRRLQTMRSFGPDDVAKSIAVNPDQITNITLECSATVSTPEDVGIAPPLTTFKPPRMPTSQFRLSVAHRSTRSRSTNDSFLTLSTASVGPLFEGGASLAKGSVCLQCEPDVSGTLSSDDPALLLLLHQEAIYRHLMLPEVDTWFTSLVEAAWDERDRLVLSAEESVTRYWLSSEEEKWRESISVFLQHAVSDTYRRAVANALSLDEIVERSRISQDRLEGMDQLSMAFFHEAQLITCRESSPRRETDGNGDQQQLLHADLPPIARPPTRAKDAPQTVIDACQRTVDDMTFLFGDQDVLVFVVDAEASIRAHLDEGERQQRRCLEVHFRNYVLDTALLRRPHGFASLTLEEAETCERRLYSGKHSGMLLEALRVMETLHRREMEWCFERDGRGMIVSVEREEWLYARRAECARRLSEEMASEESLKEFRIRAIQMEQQLSRHRHLFERAECDGRFEIVRRESRTYQILMEDALDHRLVAQAHQARYELRMQSVVWTPETYQAVYLTESSNRNRLMQGERELFLCIKSAEVSSYLHTHRNANINRDVAIQLRSQAVEIVY